jgi:hypothetical protein
MSATRGLGVPQFVGLARRSAAAFWLSALGACAPTAGQEPRSAVDPSEALGARWVGPTRVPLVLESNLAERDLAALSAVFAFWGRPTVGSTADRSLAARNGEPLLAGDLQRFARAAGLNAFAFRGTLEDVVYELQQGRPVLVGVADAKRGRERPHYEVVVGWDPAGRRLRNLDPARGFVERSFSGFESDWQLANQLTLVVFAPEPPTTLDPSTELANEPILHLPTKS